MSESQTVAQKVASVPYWYHRIDLGDGLVTPGWAPINVERYGVPDSLSGQRVLDVGAWDGFWTFEALKRGAYQAIAIDDFSDTIGGDINADRSEAWKSFDVCQSVIDPDGVKSKRLGMSVYDVDESMGTFDTVFFFGVLYHLRHPLLALEKLRSVCTGKIYIETAILQHKECFAGFYPGDEYGMNHSNWWVPTLSCAAAMCEAAGFKSVQSWKLCENPKHISESRGFVCGSV